MNLITKTSWTISGVLAAPIAWNMVMGSLNDRFGWKLYMIGDKSDWGLGSAGIAVGLLWLFVIVLSFVLGLIGLVIQALVG